MPDPDPGARDLPTLAQSIHCFRGIPSPDQSRTTPRLRARFSAEERTKVREVRRQGACLRCRMLKIECSNDNPCQPCLQSAVKGSERKVLSFCYCVRTRFADVNIFYSPSAVESAAETMRIESLMSRMGVLLARIAVPARFSLLHSDPGAFDATLASWLTDPDFTFPGGSIVGLCCSSLLTLQFDGDALADDGLLNEFRRFLLASSLAYSGSQAGSKDGMTRRDLCTAGHVSGCRLIKRLDRILTPQFLAKCGRESCQVLFLLVLGAILGVGYSSPSLLSGRESAALSAEMTLSPELQRSPTLWLAMKEHLCQMLAHHLIFLGSMLGIKFDTGLEQRIIDTAAQRWNKMESFVWADASAAFDPRLVGFREQQRPVSLEKQQIPLHWAEEPPPPAAPPPPRVPFRPPPESLVAVPCPELAHFQPAVVDAWSENPQSYLSMTDEPESYYSAEAQADSVTGGQKTEAQQRSSTEPMMPAPRWSEAPMHGPGSRREVKRRSIWLVRSFDAGSEHGQVNVHTRLRGARQTNDFGLFV